VSTGLIHFCSLSNCTLEWKPPVWVALKATNQSLPFRGQPRLAPVFNPLSSLFFLHILLNSLHSHHPVYLPIFSCSLSLPLYLSLSLLGHAYVRWPSQWMVYWPPLDTPRKITPCWVQMTSSTSEGAPTPPTCPDHQSATTSWAAFEMWVDLNESVCDVILYVADHTLFFYFLSASC